jgi:Ca2+-binding RTX toxin-like protein
LIRNNLVRLAWLELATLLLASLISAAAAANSVPATRMGSSTRPITLNDVKPTDCAAITLVNIITCGGGNCNGTGQADLILGSANVDNINARGGNDCILGGGGNDAINGGPGNGDVCIGGPGMADTFAGCETQIQ